MKFRIDSAEAKAARTKGTPASGRRVTLKQYLILVDRGFDGEEVKGWTMRRASKELAKLGIGVDPAVWEESRS